MRRLDAIGLPVEVSGWDSDGQFFAEHCMLETNESGSKTILLRRGVVSRLTA